MSMVIIKLKFQRLQMRIKPHLLPRFLGGSVPDSVVCQASLVPSVVLVPRVSTFGRPRLESGVASAKSTAASIKDGIKGLTAWVSSSAD